MENSVPALFYSNSGLHGELLYSLISGSIPYQWEKAEFGKQRHCLPYYFAIVFDGSQIPGTQHQGQALNFLLTLNHPKILLINHPPNLSDSVSAQIRSRGIRFICDSRSSQETLVERLRGSLREDYREITGAPQSPQLTRREQEILAQLTSGESNSVIAARLHLSEHTVKNHIYNIFRKIGVKNRLQASNWAKLHLEGERI
ncbi:helix-turn-helix transcriptional regulator [Microbulbifer sediminum]|uniref:helix-turn-helix transcriptional regulator n=1 Tax=Microbulbifer sediminum TaxID=2904250 RepID=UPI001F007D0B|nr:LuxR C-terminal-related transcriptional regulator [Microbulbifer sediminum]